MANQTTFDFCVFGAGLAGISIAGALSKRNASVCVIDKSEIASGASGTPTGLLNPATGRYGTKSWEAETCYQAVYSNLQETQERSPIQFFKKSGVLRPALDEKIASKIKANFDSTEWTENWCTWLNEDEIHELNPEINCVDGGLWLPIGLTVDIGTYLKTKVQFLEQQGIVFKKNADFHLNETKQGIEITFKDNSKINASNLIYAAGFNTKTSAFWDFLPLIPVKGQVAILESDKPLSFQYAISALGYIASLSDHSFVIGSTYEHKFEHSQPDEKGLSYLTKRMAKVYPSLINDSKLVRQWAGIRASTPNRMPIAGRHPQKENVFVFTGLGSKGLLYSSYLAERLSDFIIYSKALPAVVSADRIKAK